MNSNVRKILLFIGLIFLLSVLSLFFLLKFYYREYYSKDRQIAVLCYHHIGLGKPNTYSISEEKFLAQIDGLKKKGFNFISLKQLHNFYYQQKDIPMKSAVITFDDGNESVYYKVYPLLKKQKLPFAIFFYPVALNIGKKLKFMTWDQAKELAKDDLVTVGSHSYGHPILTQPPNIIQSRQGYSRWLDNEIKNSKQILEKRLGVSVNYFAAPFGAIDAASQKKINDSYLLAFNVNGMNNNQDSSPMNLNRILVTSKDTVREIVERAQEKPIVFEERYPDNLQRITKKKPIIKFKIKDLKKYKKETISFNVLRFRENFYSFNEESGFFEKQFLIKPENYYLVVVTALNKKKESCRGNWLFLYNNKIPAYLR